VRKTRPLMARYKSWSPIVVTARDTGGNQVSTKLTITFD